MNQKENTWNEKRIDIEVQWKYISIILLIFGFSDSSDSPFPYIMTFHRWKILNEFHNVSIRFYNFEENFHCNRCSQFHLQSKKKVAAFFSENLLDLKTSSAPHSPSFVLYVLLCLFFFSKCWTFKRIRRSAASLTT